MNPERKARNDIAKAAMSLRNTVFKKDSVQLIQSAMADSLLPKIIQLNHLLCKLCEKLRTLCVTKAHFFLSSFWLIKHNTWSYY